MNRVTAKRDPSEIEHYIPLQVDVNVVTACLLMKKSKKVELKEKKTKSNKLTLFLFF